MSDRISDERLTRYYASHARRIPLDDGSEPASCGEFYPAHEVDALVTELRALADAMRNDCSVLSSAATSARWCSKLDSLLSAHQEE